MQFEMLYCTAWICTDFQNITDSFLMYRDKLQVEEKQQFLTTEWNVRLNECG